MGKIDELIQQFCPDGVEKTTIIDVLVQPITDGPHETPILQEKGVPFISVEAIHDGIVDLTKCRGYISKEYDIVCSKKYKPQRGDVFMVKSASIGKVAIVDSDEDFNIWSPLAAMRCNTDRILPRFLFYVLQTDSIQNEVVKKASKSSQPNLSMRVLEQFIIPLPPQPVQEEIVRILDNFITLQTELQAELQARQEQYLYYQDLLLNKSQYSKHITIGELCVVKKGNTPIQKAKEGKYPLVATTMERRSCDTFQFNANAVCIPLVSSRGHGVASLNHVYYQEGMFALGNILCAVIPNDERVVKAKYLYYYLEYAKDYTLVPLMKGGANVSLHCSDIEKVKIPLPSLSEQERIISTLDRFDALTNDLSQGLPAEIAARQQQYEYYRDQLLTFKRKEA